MSENPKKLYECPDCYEMHDCYFDAERCCEKEIMTYYQCTECEKVHEEKTPAEECCAPDENGEFRVKPEALEKAGQLRLIP